MKSAMFAEAELTAEPETQTPQPHLKQLRPYPALQHVSCLHVPSSLGKALLLSMNNEPIWVKNNFPFPLSYFFFKNQIILTNPVHKAALQIIHLAERLLPKCKGRASSPGLNSAFAGDSLSRKHYCLQNPTGWLYRITVGHLVRGETALSTSYYCLFY